MSGRRAEAGLPSESASKPRDNGLPGGGRIVTEVVAMTAIFTVAFSVAIVPSL